VKIDSRITPSSVISIIVLILTVIVLIVVYVFPRPDSTLFTVIRVIILLSISFLFYQMYLFYSSGERLWGRGDKKDGKTSSEINRYFHDEDESELEYFIQNILELVFSALPQFDIYYYTISATNRHLYKRGFSGKDEKFKEKLFISESWEKKISEEGSFHFLTHGSGNDILKELTEVAVDNISVLVIPTIINSEVKGVLIASAVQFGDFDENNKHLMVSCAELIRTTYLQSVTLSYLRNDNSFITQMETHIDSLDIGISEDEMLASLVAFCEQKFTFDKMTLTLIDPKHKNEAIIRLIAGFDMDYGKNDRFTLDGTVHDKIIKNKNGILIENYIKEADLEGRFKKGDINEYQFMSLAGVAVSSNNGVIGTLSLESFTSRRYDDTDLKLLKAFGDKIGTLLGWWESYNHVRKTATIDGLTGLLNHRAFLERFEHELSRTNRYKTNLVLMILDLDKFKRINDSYGHLFGDYVLSETAKCLQKSVRNIDIVARYGGEEFAIVLINTVKEDVKETAVRIIENLANYNFGKDDISVRMTISAGAAEFPNDGQTVRELIASADETMYAVKKDGGNDVYFDSNAA